MVTEATTERGPVAGVLPWWPLVAIAGYAAIVAAVLLAPVLPTEQRILLWIWSTLPAQATTIGCGLFAVRRASLSRHRRIAWTLVVAALVVSFVGTTLWAWEWTHTNGVAPHTGDPIYLLVYPALGMLGLYFFLRDLGGPVRRVGVLLDALALALGFGAALWCFVIVPTAPTGAAGSSLLDTAIQSAALILPAVAAGVVYTHVPDWTEERGLGFLLVAAVITLCGDMLWAGRPVPDRIAETAVYNLLYLTANAVCTLALCLETRHRARPTPRPRVVSYSLMPALMILGCLIALAAADTPLSQPSGRIALGMLVVAALVLGLREILSQREMKRLERERIAAAAMLDREASDRAWLFEQVHEGVAQELAGLRLSMTATSRDPALAAESLRTAIDQLGRTITSTREIASRLAPLQSARGSLRLALESLRAEATASGLPCQLEPVGLDCECSPTTAELAHRVARHVFEAARADASLQSLGIHLTADLETLTLRVRARSRASAGVVLDHPGWSPLYDRLLIAGGGAEGAATPDGWWFAVHLPLVVAGPSAG